MKLIDGKIEFWEDGALLATLLDAWLIEDIPWDRFSYPVRCYTCGDSFRNAGEARSHFLGLGKCPEPLPPYLKPKRNTAEAFKKVYTPGPRFRDGPISGWLICTVCDAALRTDERELHRCPSKNWRGRCPKCKSDWSRGQWNVDHCEACHIDYVAFKFPDRARKSARGWLTRFRDFLEFDPLYLVVWTVFFEIWTVMLGIWLFS